MSFILFKPSPIERIWGGHTLCGRFTKDFPPDMRIGESWELSDNQIIASQVVSDEYAGHTLRTLIMENSARIMGPKWDASKEFPIIVKWLDCKHPLSVQVHPTIAVASKYAERAKDEVWYFAKCAPNADVIAGLNARIEKEKFSAGLKDLSFEKYLNRVRVSEGDVLYIPSGTIHTIISEVLIYEVQQNSDTTYRVYDWGRLDENGKGRALHVEKSLESINFDGALPKVVRRDNGVVCESPFFKLIKRTLKRGEKLSFAASQEPRILTLVSGALLEKSGKRVSKFETILLPYAEAFDFAAEEDSVAMVTENFTNV